MQRPFTDVGESIAIYIAIGDRPTRVGKVVGPREDDAGI